MIPEFENIDEILEKVIPQEDFVGSSKKIWEDKVLEIKTFEIEKGVEWLGVFSKDENVVVLPYRTNAHGTVVEIGILKEFNPMREGNYSDTLVTGGKDPEDETSLDTAKRELLEETGFSAEEDDRWTYLGLLTTSKIEDFQHPCYAVNLNDLTPKKINKEKIESLSKFRFIPLGQAIKSTDCFVLSLVLKFFVINNIKAFNIEEK